MDGLFHSVWYSRVFFFIIIIICFIFVGIVVVAKRIMCTERDERLREVEVWIVVDCVCVCVWQYTCSKRLMPKQMYCTEKFHEPCSNGQTQYKPSQHSGLLMKDIKVTWASIKDNMLFHTHIQTNVNSYFPILVIKSSITSGFQGIPLRSVSEDTTKIHNSYIKYCRQLWHQF